MPDNNKNIYNNITDIIDSGTFTEPEIIKMFLKKIIEYNENKLDTLKSEVFQEVSQINHLFTNPEKIHTALVENQFVSKSSPKVLGCFHPVKDFKNISNIYSAQNSRYNLPKKADFIGVFFKSSYSDFITITDQNTNTETKIKIKFKNTDKTQETSCCFLKNNIFIESEQILKKIFEQYGFDEPFVYSPYARRFAELKISVPVNIESVEKIDFIDNRISSLIEATTFEKTLVWNIEFKPPCSAFSNTIDGSTIQKLSIGDTNSEYRSNEYIIPHSNGKDYSCKNIYKCDTNEYLLFDGVGKTKIGIGRNTEKKLLYITHDNISKLEPLTKMIIDRCSGNDLEKLDPSQVFQNYYSSTLFKKQRLYSYADICYAVNGFNGNPYNIEIDIENIKIDTQEHINQIEENQQNVYITDYNTFDRYYESTNPKLEPYRTIKSVSKAACILTFNRTSDFKGNINFIEDYARYVLSYLNEKYPEFYWKGKKGWSS